MLAQKRILCNTDNMSTIKEQIEKILGMPVSTSNVDLCDYQCNAAFALAKEQKRNPMEVAEEISNRFNSGVADRSFCHCERKRSNPTAVADACPPGFVNFKVTDSALETAANKILTTNHLPLATVKPRTIFFDYGGANVAKELHIGHLRPPIIGEALKRVFKALGHKTVSDTFLGDWGLQMGLVLAQLIDEGYTNEDKFIKPVTLDTFNELYPKASKRKNNDPAFYKRAEDITVHLQRKEQPFYKLWQHIHKISVAKIRGNYLTLSCTFDTYNGESDAQPYIEKVLDIAQKNGAMTSDGCLILDVKEPTDTRPMPPIILKKSNDGDLYSTTDLATVFYRYRDHTPDEFVYVVDSRQELHLEQVFRSAHKIGIVPRTVKFKHVSLGTMNGSDGKPFKTRAGGVIKLEDVFDLVTKKAYEKSSSPAAKKNAQAIGLAALKFADLSNNVRKDYVFDIDKFTSFEGKTGPYLLYTVARINSVLKNPISVSRSKICLSPPLQKGELWRDIIMRIVKLADSYSTAASNYTLNGIIDAAYELAAAFNLFYANVKIADNPTALAIAKLVKTALLFALDTLAIEPVSEM